MSSGNFKVKIDIDPVKEIIKRHGLQDDGPVIKAFRNEVDAFSDPYVPFKKGTLKNTKDYPDNHSIRYIAPYARIHYHGKIMVDPEYKVGGFYDKKNDKWYSRSNVKKIKSDRDFKYNGAPKRGAHWDKRMWDDKGEEICKNLKEFIKKNGK